MHDPCRYLAERCKLFGMNEFGLRRPQFGRPFQNLCFEKIVRRFQSRLARKLLSDLAPALQ